MRNRRILGNLLMLVLTGTMAMNCTFDQNANPQVPGPPEQAYVGSEACSGCHTDIYNSFVTTGHPYKLQEVVDGVAPEYPFSTLEYLPSGYTWDDMSYVIGGYYWKARYVDANGYIVTGDDVQWNMQTEEAVPYHADEDPGTKMYDCGRCHTTGWVSVDDGGNPQNDLDGMAGEFFEGGIQCEQCHGQGGLHTFSKSADDIEVDRSSELCGSCHYRNEDHTIAAKGGFIKHHEQYDEMISAGHKDLSCNDCHNPHKTTKYDQTGGIIKECTECHTEITNNTEHKSADCVTCHLPWVTKSATSVNKYKGDIKTHIFKINPAEDGKMFNDDGTLANGETGVTIDYVCYQCHKDSDGIGGDAFTLSKASISARGTDYHE